jgi:hypothetical protein
MSCSSASVGFWPSERMTVPSSLVVMVPVSCGAGAWVLHKWGVGAWHACVSAAECVHACGARAPVGGQCRPAGQHAAGKGRIGGRAARQGGVVGPRGGRRRQLAGAAQLANNHARNHKRTALGQFGRAVGVPAAAGCGRLRRKHVSAAAARLPRGCQATLGEPGGLPGSSKLPHSQKQWRTVSVLVEQSESFLELCDLERKRQAAGASGRATRRARRRRGESKTASNSVGVPFAAASTQGRRASLPAHLHVADVTIGRRGERAGRSARRRRSAASNTASSLVRFSKRSNRARGAAGRLAGYAPVSWSAMAARLREASEGSRTAEGRPEKRREQNGLQQQPHRPRGHAFFNVPLALPSPNAP